MAQRATSLGPKPSLFYLCLFFCWFVFFFGFVFFGGFKGQVRWPKGSPHLALSPPYFLFVLLLSFSCFCFSLFLLKNRKKNLFSPLKKGIFVVNSSVFPFVYFLALFGALSPFFLTLSLSLGFCLSLVLFLLPSFLFLISVFWLLLLRFCFVCFLCFKLFFCFLLFCLLSGCCFES